MKDIPLAHANLVWKIESKNKNARESVRLKEILAKATDSKYPG